MIVDYRNSEPLSREDQIQIGDTYWMFKESFGINDACAHQRDRIHVEFFPDDWGACGYPWLGGCLEYADGLKGSVDPNLRTPIIGMRERYRNDAERRRAHVGRRRQEPRGHRVMGPRRRRPHLRAA